MERKTAALPQILGVAVLAVLSAIVGFAQSLEAPIDLEPLKQRVKELLWSPLPKQQAWGAYLIGEFGLDDLAPELIAFVGRGEYVGFDGDHEFGLRAAVDSMIRLEITPPDGLIDPYFESISYEAIVLFSHAPSDYPEGLLQLVQTAERPSERFAAMNLMLEGRVPGAASWLLEGLTISATVRISDPGRGGGVGSGSCGGTGGRCLRRLQIPEGYPPIGIYDLHRTPFAGSVQISSRVPQHVYYLRVETSPDTPNLDHCERVERLDRLSRMQYVAVLAMRSAQTLPLGEEYSARVVPARGGSVERTIADLKSEIWQDYELTVDLLRENSQLARDDAMRLQPQIDLVVIDDRRNVQP